MSANLKVGRRIATPRNNLTTRSKKVNLFDFDDQLLKLLSNCDESIILEPEKFKEVFKEVNSSPLTRKQTYRAINKSDIYYHLVKLEDNLDREISKHNGENNLQEHMTELHNYNELKDATQQLLGTISAQIGVSVKELHKRDIETEFSAVNFPQRMQLKMYSSEDEELSSSSLDEDDIINIDKKYVKQAFKMILGTSTKDQKRNGKRKAEDVVSKAVKKARNDCSCKRLNMLSLMPTDVLPWMIELRAFLIRQDFVAAAKCLYELLDRRLVTMPVLWKVSSIILLNYPNLTAELVKEFLQMNYGLLLPEDMQTFLEDIFKLPNSINGNFNGTK